MYVSTLTTQKYAYMFTTRPCIHISYLPQIVSEFEEYQLSQRVGIVPFSLLRIFSIHIHAHQNFCRAVWKKKLAHTVLWLGNISCLFPSLFFQVSSPIPAIYWPVISRDSKPSDVLLDAVS